MSNIVSVPGTLRGYRAWVASAAGGSLRLTPLTNRYDMHTWSTSTCRATCSHQRAFVPYDRDLNHEAPCFECSCGVHARYRVLDADLWGYPMVVGSIQAHGRIVLQEHGFRAEYARVEALAGISPYIYAGMPVDWSPIMQGFAEQYGVGYVRTWNDLLEQYPPANLEGLLPPPNDEEPRAPGYAAQYLRQMISNPPTKEQMRQQLFNFELKDPTP